MTDLTANHAGHSGNIFTSPLTRLWDGLVFLAENSSRAKAVNALSAMSDAELARRGTSRAEMARKIFADKYYL
jgi:hypothetical protein